jgi:hypothetical protein
MRIFISDDNFGRVHALQNKDTSEIKPSVDTSHVNKRTTTLDLSTAEVKDEEILAYLSVLYFLDFCRLVS